MVRKVGARTVSCDSTLVQAFFKHIVKEKAKPSAFKGAIEVMNFSKHVLGLYIEDGVGNSPSCSGCWGLPLGYSLDKGCDRCGLAIQSF